ncbi:FMN-linked oxidoreductase [Conidiobolus coronatus NRRL 28638]|uniref:FMN-linked oxidoreductase n=1 Tax=Conidiobolus coronatus (strain ATCC 28846 / CBS 209.66 / NRRL 28638) TaxID=796925 RepID=A0A137P1S7_CONC2|nr:FMN-linked oxidoreductase [Conidiobolus coronatus NRRL 28638]|eukprot:KXN68831.1 FMN-linked oxidoreductase [Conidiobolus coronatus NRRL 28638]
MEKCGDEVHAKSRVIFAQLMHFERAANTLHKQGIAPPALSAIRANAGKFRLLVGSPGYSTPEAIDDPKEYIQLFKRAAENEKLTGTDSYGGSIKNRSRFILETIDSLQEVYDKKQIEVKLNPSGGHNDSGEGSKVKIVELYSYLINEIDSKDIGYFQFIHYTPLIDPTGRGIEVDIQEFHPLIKNAVFFANTRFNAEDGNNYVGDGIADVIAY